MCDNDDMGQVHLLFLRFGQDKYGILEVDGVHLTTFLKTNAISTGTSFKSY